MQILNIKPSHHLYCNEPKRGNIMKFTAFLWRNKRRWRKSKKDSRIIYLLAGYTRSVLWGVAVRLSYMQDAWYLEVKKKFNSTTLLYRSWTLNRQPSLLYFRIVLTYLYVSRILTCFSCQASPPQSCRSWPQHELQLHRHLPPFSWESYWLSFQYTSQVLLQVTVWRWTCYLSSSYPSFSSNYHTQICKSSNYNQIKRGQKKKLYLYRYTHAEKCDFMCILLFLTHPWGQMDSMWRTQIWWSFLPQSWHSTNGSNSRWSFFISLNWSFFIALQFDPQHILVQINL